MIKIGIVGTGYVGLVTGICLSDFGWQVSCVDKNEEIVRQLINGKVTIYEPGLEDLLLRNSYYKRVRFTTDIEEVVNESDVIFIAVGTPQNPDGSANLTNIYEAAHQIGRFMNGYKIIVDKSTVPVGTGQTVKKYASNAFLATKISFVNELSELCEKTGANIQQVAKGMGMDGRIGSKFLHAGPGFGGSCFPKDTKALVNLGDNYQCDLEIVKATIQANEKQKRRLADKIKTEMGSLEGKKFGVLGLSFKNNTDDMREVPVLSILKELSLNGAQFKVYDPKAMEKASVLFMELNIHIMKYCDDEYEASEDTDAVILMTEWNQFRSLDIDQIKSKMRGNYFFDLRNIYSKEAMSEKGFQYFSVGRS